MLKKSWFVLAYLFMLSSMTMAQNKPAGLPPLIERDLFFGNPEIAGAEHLGTGYKKDGIGAHWRGIFDDKGRIMVAISFNSDVGDSWEWADIPRYPEKYSALGIRIGVNYVIYAMTH